MDNPVELPVHTVQVKMESKPTLTPPTSEEAGKHGESSSDLSDLELDQEDNGEIEPDHYYEGGRIPVFKPTMKQFKSFKAFVDKIDKYGMKSGIVKVIPPKEWHDSLPALDEAVKTIKVKNPITQEFHGTHGTYTQANMEKQRSYNLAQWKALTEESNHQPPAKRGERRRNQEKVLRGGAAPRAARKAPVVLPDGKKRGPGRPRTRPLPTTTHQSMKEASPGMDNVQAPITPTSPTLKPTKVKKEPTSDGEDGTPSRAKGRQPKSVSSRRKHNSREQADFVDEEAFKGFDYRVYNLDEWSTERCQELETAYWKSLTFNNPMYGADMPGSLFDDTTSSWNVAKLENLLDVLGQKVPGVNTAYLYLGMWKATFAWHLEDVDLYSINYIHFGAPKQWYSISQTDARRFERAMRTLWPNDAKNCDQFLRHKTYLISPQILKSQYNIEVNRLVHHEGEFVITFPYGYHSGYNLGYNCAESVNFATEAWLDYGKVARKCNCEADSVWVDVWDIERKLRGEQTPEYYEETEEEEDEDEEEIADLPTPPGSERGKARSRASKRKREATEKDSKPKKKVMLRLKAPASKEVCVLCPNDPPHEELLPTDMGKNAHRKCAEYVPETEIFDEAGRETVFGINQIDKARLDLKCNYCRNKMGAVFQCSFKRCTRAFHATCAAPAGVQVDKGIVPCFIEDGTEYTHEGIDFRCRFHRPRRPKYPERQACSQALEENSLIRRATMKLQKSEIVQYQYYGSDIYAGMVVENRPSEQMVLLDALPKGGLVEVEHKWVLVLDKAHSHLPIPSETAKPLPAHLARKSQTTAEHPANETPKVDDPFFDPKGPHIWAEFNAVAAKLLADSDQVRVDLHAPKRLWHYLGKTSTEAKAQYTSDIAAPINDPAANFLDSLRPAADANAARAPQAPVNVQHNQRRSYPASYPTSSNNKSTAIPSRKFDMNSAHQSAHQSANHQPPPVSLSNDQSRQTVPDKPYKGKYSIKTDWNPPRGMHIDTQSLQNQQNFTRAAEGRSSSFSTLNGLRQAFQAPTATMGGTSMSDIHRRLSSPQQSIEKFRRLSQSSHNRQWPSLPQQQAPVANMISSNSPTTQSSISRPSTSHHTPPSSAHSSVASRSRSDSFKALAKYPYLQEAAAQRPPVYQSPYAPGGGITEAWLPHPDLPKPRRPRAGSLAQDFLMKRTPSQREAVKGHVRTISMEKALLRQQESERLHREQQQRHRNTMPPPAQPLSPSLMSNPLFQPDAYTSRPFSDTTAFPDLNSNGYSHTHAHPYSPMHLTNDALPFGSSFPQAHSGLQFSSPHDFQLQMRREAESQTTKPPLMTHERNSYHAFVRDLQSGRGMQSRGHNGADDDVEMGGVSGADGTSGSPLRRGLRAAGGEMLPMMQDPSF